MIIQRPKAESPQVSHLTESAALLRRYTSQQLTNAHLSCLRSDESQEVNVSPTPEPRPLAKSEPSSLAKPKPGRGRLPVPPTQKSPGSPEASQSPQASPTVAKQSPSGVAGLLAERRQAKQESASEPASPSASPSPTHEKKLGSKSVILQRVSDLGASVADKKDGSSSLSASGKGLGGSRIVQEKCFTCNKTVYATEKISADSKVFHKGCFKVRAHSFSFVIQVSFFPFM